MAITMTMFIVVLTVLAVTSSISSAVGHKQSLISPRPIKGSKDILHAAKTIDLIGAIGPESLAFDHTGHGPYTGVADGRILKWRGISPGGWTNFAYTSTRRNECLNPAAPDMEPVCGRPLGLRFHNKTGDLYIADAYFGLKVVGRLGGLARQLVSEVEGQPLRFTNDMDIDQEEDVIYFTDSSSTYQRRDFMSLFLSGDQTGRLIKYNIASRKVTVLLRGLSFANGVALSQDRSFVLVAETSTTQVIRFWLKGPKAGKHDIFAKLPGYPDNIRKNSKGEFWVAMHAKEGLIADLALKSPCVGNALLNNSLTSQQLHSLVVGEQPHAVAVKLSENGKILQVVEDSKGKTVQYISEVDEKYGKLWIGSVLMPFVGVFDL